MHVVVVVEVEIEHTVSEFIFWKLLHKGIPSLSGWADAINNLQSTHMYNLLILNHKHNVFDFRLVELEVVELRQALIFRGDIHSITKQTIFY